MLVLEKWFQKTFISIMPLEDGYDILCVSVKNNKIILREQNHFVGEVPSVGMNRYIKNKIGATPYFYISTINLHRNQGAYEGCAHPSAHFHHDVVGISALKRNNLWTQYAQAEELHSLKSHYAAVGLDFIFSPFSMIEFYFADKIPDTFALYAFGGVGFFAVAIFDAGKLEYAHYYTTNSAALNVAHKDEKEVELSFNHDIEEHDRYKAPIVLDDIEGLDELDLLDDLDAFSEIADLDDLDEVSEFSEDTVTPEEIRHIRDNGMESAKHTIDNLGEEYERFEFIQKTLERFYASPHCNNRFVETVCIADINLGGNDLKRYLEEELFVNVLVRHVDSCEGIHALAVMEVEQL